MHASIPSQVLLKNCERLGLAVDLALLSVRIAGADSAIRIGSQKVLLLLVDGVYLQRVRVVLSARLFPIVRMASVERFCGWPLNRI